MFNLLSSFFLINLQVHSEHIQGNRTRRAFHRVTMCRCVPVSQP
jgi:hypothetical protein